MTPERPLGTLVVGKGGSPPLFWHASGWEGWLAPAVSGC